MSDKPVAIVKERDVWQWQKKPNINGRMEKVKLPKGKETVRTAFCFLHRKHSKMFVGPNESGWVFFCAGLKPLNPDGTSNPEHPGHYFIASPPA